MISPGVVAAIRAVGVRGDTCGAMRCIAPLNLQEHRCDNRKCHIILRIF